MTLWRPMLSLLLFGLAAFSVYERVGAPQLGCSFQHHRLSYERARVAVSEGYAAILGSYWDIWRVVHQAAEIGHREGRPERVFPTGYRAEVFAQDAFRRIAGDLQRNGSYRILCLEPGKDGTEFGQIDCRQLLTWNKFWGALPMVGAIQKAHYVPSLRAEAVTVVLGTVHVGEVLEFRRDTGAERFLVRGWSAPEGFGTWTNGRRAEMMFKLDLLAEEDLVMVFNIASSIGAFVSHPPSVVVKVFVNEVQVDQWTFTTGAETGERRSLVPRDVLARAGATTVALEIFDPHSPRSLGFAPRDRRELGIAVGSLRFVRAVAPRTHLRLGPPKAQ